MLTVSLLENFPGTAPRRYIVARPVGASYCIPIKLIPLGSVVIEQTGRYFMAGKWKMTGDGGVGQPYTSFK